MNFSIGDKKILTVSDPFMDKPASVSVYDFGSPSDLRDKPALCITKHGHVGRITGAYWMPMNRAILTTGSDGMVKLFNPKTGDFIEEHKIHNGDITGLSFDKERILCITSSKDNTSKVSRMDR